MTGTTADRAGEGGRADTVRERIVTRLPTMSAKHRLVADAVLANPSRALVSTVSELAQRVGVVPATVVRFAQSLGYPGFPEFREGLRSEFPALRSPLERLDDDVSEAGGSAGAMLQRVQQQTIRNVQQTFARLDPQSIERAIDLLLVAPRVVIVGAGTSHILALHLHRTLQSAGIPSELLRDWYDLLYTPRLAPGCVLFATTVWRYSKVTVEAVRVANEAGASTILLTDADVAPGASLADITLLYSPHAIGEHLSPAAGAVVIDCLAAGLAARAPDRVKQGLNHQHELAMLHRLIFD